MASKCSLKQSILKLGSANGKKDYWGKSSLINGQWKNRIAIESNELFDTKTIFLEYKIILDV